MKNNKTKMIPHINIETEIVQIYDNLETPFNYSPKDYGLPECYTGSGVKICLIDSGTPEHKDILVEGDKVNFCEHTKNVVDKNGHATMLSGLINANNKNGIIGIAPLSKIHYAKVVGDNGKCCFNSVVAAILWAIVKEVDIIILPIGTKYDYTILHDAIIKARKSNIIVIASGGNEINEQKDMDYPSIYPEAFSVLSNEQLQKNDKINKDFSLNASGLITTYTADKYVKASGSSLATALVGGLVALIIEQHRKEKKSICVNTVYEELSKIL